MHTFILLYIMEQFLGVTLPTGKDLYLQEKEDRIMAGK
jgi:hypothetical protein